MSLSTSASFYYSYEWKPVGNTTIQNKTTNQDEVVIIEKQRESPGNYNYRMIKSDPEFSKKTIVLGNLGFCYAKRGEDDNYYCGELQISPFSLWYRYGKERSPSVDKITVSDLVANNRNYKGIGSRLMQVAIEASLIKKCDGKLDLVSVASALGFYFKIGLRTRFQETDDVIEKIVKTTIDREKIMDTTESLLKGQYMYMTQDAIQEWCKKIRHSAILRKSANLTV